jgi:hypothetical protein
MFVFVCVRVDVCVFGNMCGFVWLRMVVWLCERFFIMGVCGLGVYVFRCVCWCWCRCGGVWIAQVLVSGFFGREGCVWGVCVDV